jgi:hypothetical protein
VHSCENTARKGWSWPNFWANLASFSHLIELRRAVLARVAVGLLRGRVKLAHREPQREEARRRRPDVGLRRRPARQRLPEVLERARC